MTKVPKFFCSLIIIFVSIFLVTTMDAGASEQERYVSVMPDIPIMHGLDEDTQQSILFDKEQGKVAQTVLLGPKIAVLDIQNYYKESLPALGWEAQKTWVFVRNNEQLIVNIEKVGGGGRVEMVLSPKRP